jgi:hypothetical protein
MGRDTCALPERCLDCGYTTNGRIVVSYVILCTRANVLYVNSASAPMHTSLRVQGRFGSTVLLVRVSSPREMTRRAAPSTILSSMILDQVRQPSNPQFRLISTLTRACRHTWPCRFHSSSHPAAAIAPSTCPQPYSASSHSSSSSSLLPKTRHKSCASCRSSHNP